MSDGLTVSTTFENQLMPGRAIFPWVIRWESKCCEGQLKGVAGSARGARRRLSRESKRVVKHHRRHRP